jgi:hypothetical protein
MSNKVIKSRKKENIDISSYVNIETGETLVSEMNGYKMNMSVSTEGDYIVIKK